LRQLSRGHLLLSASRQTFVVFAIGNMLHIPEMAIRLNSTSEGEKNSSMDKCEFEILSIHRLTKLELVGIMMYTYQTAH
jgi:hypothetical protein